MLPKFEVEAISEGWAELESDPGLFTLLVQDFGVNGVEVKEVYDLSAEFDTDIYGFIFLFKWAGTGRRVRRKFESSALEVKDEEVLRSFFFAHQIIPNSCATHALLSILMNSENLDLGHILEGFKRFTQGLDPECKGYAIGNMPDLATAHNKHARPDAMREALSAQKGTVSSSASTTSSNSTYMDTFHFASFVPIHGHLYELDGLKQYPVHHGIIPENQHWTELFRSIIFERIEQTKQQHGDSEEIRYNLMAVTPSTVSKSQRKLGILEKNRRTVIEALQKLVSIQFPGMLAEAESGDVLSMVGKLQTAFSKPSPASGLAMAAEDPPRAKIAKFDSVLANSPQTEFPPLTAPSLCYSSVEDVKPETVTELPVDCCEKLEPESISQDGESLQKTDPEPSGKLSEISAPVEPNQEGSADYPVASVKEKIESQSGIEATTAPAGLTEETDSMCQPGDGSVSADVNDVSTPAESCVSDEPSTSAPASCSHPAEEAIPDETMCSMEGPSGVKLLVCDQLTVDTASMDSSSHGSVSGTSYLSWPIASYRVSPEVELPCHPATGGASLGLTESLAVGPTRARTIPVLKLVSTKQGSHEKSYTIEDLVDVIGRLDDALSHIKACIQDEEQKMQKYKEVDCRRTHDYDPFLRLFLWKLVEAGILKEPSELISQSGNVKSRKKR